MNNSHAGLKALLRSYGRALAISEGYPSMCPIGRMRELGTGGRPVFGSRIPSGVERLDRYAPLAVALEWARETNGPATATMQARYVWDVPARTIARELGVCESTVWARADLGLSVLENILAMGCYDFL